VVEDKSAAEILATLDDEGALDWLPESDRGGA